MKKTVLFAYIIIILTTFTGIIFASLTLQYFTAKTSGEGIFVEWKTSDEGGTSRFEIERSAANPDNFIFIKSVSATGNNSYYSFQDDGVNFKTSEGSSIYFYRLKCYQPNGSYTYTNTISVVHAISGIKTTWGSIKAIFR
jgi:hypothetical protein